MNNEAEAADLILRITLNGTAYFFKLAATLSKPVIDKVAQAIHEALYSHGIGTTDPVMAELIKRGEGLSVFQIPETELGKFQEIMKPTGIKYATVLSKEETAEDRTTLIICSSGEAEVINRILVQNRLHGRSVADATQEKQEPVEKPEAPVEAVTPEQDSEEAKKRNAEFVKYYIKREGSSEENPTQATERKNESPSGRKLQTIVLNSSFDIRNSSREVKVDSPASAASGSPGEQPTDVEQAVVTEILDVDTKREPGQWPDERHYDFLRRQARKEEKYDVDPDRIIDVEPEELKPVPDESKEREQSEPRSDGRFSIRKRIQKIKKDMAQKDKAPAAEAPAKSSVLESVEQQLKSQAEKDPQIGE